MKLFELHREQFLPVTPDKAWDFFSLPANLERITPPEVKFKTITCHEEGIRLHDGMRIRYKLRPLFGVPFVWETEIRDVQWLSSFMDKQLKGPYAFWEHSHIFTPVEGGVKMTDTVRYALPLGWIGLLLHALVVRRRLNKIFVYRKEAVARALQ